MCGASLDELGMTGARLEQIQRVVAVAHERVLRLLVHVERRQRRSCSPCHPEPVEGGASHLLLRKTFEGLVREQKMCGASLDELGMTGRRARDDRATSSG
jgi:hypothetical protein